MHPEGLPTDVNIASESGERITIERNVERHSEHNVYRTDIGAWPEDKPSQRAWALSVVTQKLIPLFKTDDDLSELFAAAERIVEWVETGKEEES